MNTRKNIEVIINGKNVGLKKAVNESKSVLNDLGNTVKTVGVAFASAFAFDKVVTGINNVVNSIDNLTHTADKLGLTTQALDGLRFAADNAGISANEFDNSLQRLVRRTAEAAVGTGEAVQAFNELGISAKKLTTLSADQQLLVIADAMENLSSHTDKVRIAFKLFDTEGVKMINMLDGGSDSILNYTNQVQNLGVVTDKQTKAISEFKEVTTLLDKTLEGVGTQITANVVPSLTQLFKDTLTAIGGMEGFGKIIAVVSTVINGFVKLLGVMGSALKTALSGINTLVKGIDLGANSIWQMIKDGTRSFMGYDKTNFANSMAGIKLHKKELEALTKKQLDFNKAVSESEKVTTDLTSNLKSAIDETLSTYDDALKQINTKGSSVVTTPQMDVNLGVGETNSKLTKKVKETGKKHGRVYKAGVEDGTKGMVDDLSKTFDSVGETLTNSFDGFFDSLMQGTQSFGDAFKAVIRDISIQLTKQLLISPTTSQGGSFLSGLFKNMFSGTSFDFLGMFANGGVIGSPTALATPTGLAVAGEKGAEAILPLTRVNGKLGVATDGSGNNVNVNVYNYANDNVSVNQNGDEIDIIINQVASNISRGVGTIPTALEHRYGLRKV